MIETMLRVGYIPLVDATALLVAVDMGFTREQGLEVELVREMSWSNVRDKLNIGLFDAAHLLSPVAVASSLGIGHVRVPLVTPFNLGLNGNAITVSPRLFASLSSLADGDIADPLVSARALARVVAERKARGSEPLNFGMTFPFSNHNYQLRLWMAAGAIDPDEDVRLVVLPPPYMVDSLASGHVDGFCVGAPWNSVAVDSGIGRILHFGCDIVARATEKVFAVRKSWGDDNPGTLSALVRALAAASDFVEDQNNLVPVSAAVARRLGVEAELVMRTLTGNMKISPDGSIRTSNRYIMIGCNGATRPDPVQAAWIYAQLVRWGQAPMSVELLNLAQAVFRRDLFDVARGVVPSPRDGEPADGIGAFVGPDFVAGDVAGYLAAWRGKRAERPRLSVVR
jgi:ABC-type nitrate/sulfonate/bicarbonate transport system substrate-binding protein